MLFGIPFLRPNRLHVLWGSREQNDRLDAGNGRFIPVTCLSERRPGSHDDHRIYAIKAAQSVTIPPGHGFHVKIQHGNTPIVADGYVVDPITKTDCTANAYASLMNCIATGQETHLPMANLGSATIHITCDGGTPWKGSTRSRAADGQA